MKQRKAQQLMTEAEFLIHQNHLHLKPTDEYKGMMDKMLEEEASGEAKYVSLEDIKKKFRHHT